MTPGPEPEPEPTFQPLKPARTKTPLNNATVRGISKAYCRCAKQWGRPRRARTLLLLYFRVEIVVRIDDD
jgi:hypothetical protein